MGIGGILIHFAIVLFILSKSAIRNENFPSLNDLKNPDPKISSNHLCLRFTTVWVQELGSSNDSLLLFSRQSFVAIRGQNLLEFDIVPKTQHN